MAMPNGKGKKGLILRPANIPQLVKEFDHWLVWRYEDNPRPDKKPLKVPYYTNGRKRMGQVGTEKDIGKLDTFDAALEACKERGMDGVGLAVLPEQNLTILDLDECIDEHGNMSEFAGAVIGSGVYTERSPSGRGLRAVYQGAIAPDQKLNFHIANGERVEVYCGKAYVTFTGNVVYDKANPLSSKTGGLVVRVPTHIRKTLEDGMGSKYGDRRDSITSGNGVTSPAGLVSMNAVGLPNFSAAQAEAVLKKLPDDWGQPGEGTWYRAAAALHLQFDGSEEGYRLLDEWSATKEGYDEEANRRRWDAGFSHDRGKDDLTTMKSLVYKAMDNGCKIKDKTLKDWGLRRAKGKGTGVDDDEAQEESVEWESFNWADFAAASERPMGAVPLVKDWAYKKTVVLFSSNGGAGKTYTTLTFCATVALGKPWFGVESEKGRVLYVGAEDELAEVAHRLWGICEAYGYDKEELAGQLDIFGMVHISRKALYVGEGYGDGEFTVQFDRLKEKIVSGGYSYVALDNLSKFYMANENARAMVDEFVSGLAGLAVEHGLVVLLLGHDSKAGAGYSGSTQWHNSARARWSLERNDLGRTVLVVEKNNYGMTGHGGQFSWNTQHGVLFMGDEVGPPAEGTATAEFQRAEVLRAVIDLYYAGEDTPFNSKGELGAIEQRPELLAMGMNAEAIRRHIRMLVDGDELVLEHKGSHGKKRKAYVRPPSPENPLD